MSPIRRHLRWPLDIATNLSGGTLFVVLAGRISGRSAGTLEAALAGIDGGVRVVVLDLAAVDYISSAGLNLIEALASRLAREGRTLTLAGVAEPVRIALELAGLSEKITST